MNKKKVTKQIESDYCPTHTNMRMKAIYTRSSRETGQKWLSSGRVCPICFETILYEDVITGSD